VAAPRTFDYAIIRVVPRVEREEFLNAGVILYCLTADFLGARVVLSRERLLSFAPGADAESIAAHLEAIPRLCAGGAAAGPVGQLTQKERWHWLISPRSTVIQTSAVHSGVCASREPQAELDRIFDRMARVR
jgi:hypothetical protein